MRRVDLAMAIGRTASGVTRLLRPLEKIGLVSRNSSERDARVSLVTLTNAGAEKLSDATITVNEIGQRLTKVIGDSQLDSLTASLEVLRE
jgi:DNA-binding MarR family transcriptional regulator